MSCLTPTTRAALRDAIWEDHPCGDRGCDIAVAWTHGYLEAAAHLLMGATEAPATHQVVQRCDLTIGDVHSPAFDRWCKFHHKHGRQCESCEGFMYANPDTGWEPFACSNCGAILPTDNREVLTP